VTTQTEATGGSSIGPTGQATIGSFLWYTIPDGEFPFDHVRQAWFNAGLPATLLPRMPQQMSGNRIRTILWRYMEDRGAEQMRAGVWFIASTMDESDTGGTLLVAEMRLLVHQLVGSGNFHGIGVPRSEIHCDYLRDRLLANFAADHLRFEHTLTQTIKNLPTRRRALSRARVDALLVSQDRFARRMTKIERVIGGRPSELDAQMNRTSASLVRLSGMVPA
jgi:hypothetical protein